MFVPKPRVWKLKDEETVRLFTREMAVRNDDVTKANDIQQKWLAQRFQAGVRNDERFPRHRETWWLNRDVEVVVAIRTVCHKA